MTEAIILNLRPCGELKMKGALKKPLFVHAQDWYRPSICVDCPEFNFVPLSEGGVAYCIRIENDCQCIFKAIEGEKTLDPTTILLGTEAVHQVAAD